MARTAIPSAQEWLIARGWPTAQVFLLKAELSDLPPALLAIGSLTSLDLTGNPIGDAGPKAIALRLIPSPSI